MNESPCKQCISFAICKVQINIMEIPDVTQFSIARDCKTLVEYIRGDSDGIMGRVNIARKTLGIGVLYE